MGFANHGGMWDDLVLLPIANAAIAPHLALGLWCAAAIAAATAASILVHVHWYRGHRVAHSPEHMWPTRPYGSWFRDLSIAGWLHVLYVIGELTVLVGFLLYSMPLATVLLVTAVFTIHLPIGLLQPRWFLTGRIARLREQPLLVPCLVALWAAATLKMAL